MKQHLFLSPITSGERRGLSSLPQSSHDEKHDTLELAIAPRGTTCGGGAIIGSQELFGFGFSPVELCPLLAPYSAPFDSAMKALHFKKDACDRLDVLDFVGHSGSQRGMYLTNSPCKESYLLPDLELKTHSRKIIKPATTLRDNWGITLGTLFDRLLNDVGEYIFLEEVNEEACSGSSTVSFDAMSLSHAITKWGIYRWERYRFISSEFR